MKVNIWLNKKVMIASILVGAVALFFFSVPKVSASVVINEPIYSSNGEELRYGTPYYIRDKGMAHRGGLTYEPYASYDYALFSHVSSGRGETVVFENAANKSSKEVIRSGNKVKVKFEGSNWGWRYTYFVRGSKDVYLDIESKASIFEIYGTKSDSSFALGNGQSNGPAFNTIQGNRSGSKSWLGYGTTNAYWTPGGVVHTTLRASR